MVRNKKQKRSEFGKKDGNLKIFGSILFSFILIIILMSFVSAATNITNCQTLSSAGETYTLNTSISNNTITTDCIIISTQNITLSCQGYSISSTQNYSGVYSNQYNTTVRNCNVSMGQGNNTNSIGIEMTDAADNSNVINNTINGNMYYGISFAAGNNGPDNSLIENNTINVSGIDGSIGIYLYASSNNILRNNNATALTSSGIYLYNNADNNNLTNNRGTSNSGYGIGISGDGGSGDNDNNLLTNNIVTSNSSHGIYISRSSDNSFTSNTGTSTSGSGFYFDSNAGGTNNLTSNTGTSASGHGIYISTPINFLLTNNTGTSVSGVGINLYYGGNNSTLINNVGTSTSNVGFDLYEFMNNNTLRNNIGRSNSSLGMRIRRSSNNYVVNNTATSNSNDGISIGDSSRNNTFINNTFTTNSSYALWIGGSSNNVFTTQRAEGYLTGSYGVFLSASIVNSENNIFQDCINISGVLYDVYYNPAANTLANNTFINCTYDISKESVGAAGNSLIRKWYYRAYVNDSIFGFGLNNSNVLAGIEMPNNQQVIPEINMTGNVLLMHFNNQSGYENSTHVYDWSGNGNNGTVNGGAVMNMTGGKHRGTGVFDGVDDYVDVGNGASLNLNYNFTISLWFKTNSSSAQGIIDKKYNHLISGYEITLSNGEVFGYFGNATDQRTLDTDTIVSGGIWHQAVFSRNSSGNYFAYIDGILKTTAADNGNINSSEVFYIGFRSGIGNWFNGTIDEVAIWNRSLSADEVLSLYNAQAKYFNLTTNATGYTNQTEITEYYNNGGTRIYYNNYTINAEKTGYATTSRGYNVSAQSGFNNLNDVFSLTENIFPLWNFLSPTQANNTFINATSTEINVSFVEANLNEIKYNWNGTNFTLYNDSLVLMINFDNLSAIGENSTLMVDVSKYCYDNETEILTLEEIDCSLADCNSDEFVCENFNDEGKLINKIAESDDSVNNDISNVIKDKKGEVGESEESNANQETDTSQSTEAITSDLNINDKENKKEGKIPQRSEHIFQVSNYSTDNYINLSIYNYGAENALVAQRSEHLSEKQGLPRHLGSSPSQGATSALYSKQSKTSNR